MRKTFGQAKYPREKILTHDGMIARDPRTSALLEVFIDLIKCFLLGMNYTLDFLKPKIHVN